MDKIYLKRIKEQRDAKRLNQDEVAYSIGVSSSAYSRMETGSTEMTVKAMLKICDVLGLQPSQLFAENASFENEKFQTYLPIRLSSNSQKEMFKILMKNKDKDLQFLDEI